MWVNRLKQLLRRHAELYGQDRFHDEVGGFGAVEGDPQDLMSLGMRQDLGEADAFLHRPRLAAGADGECPCLVGDSFCLELVFPLAHDADLRVGEHDRRDGRIDHVSVVSRDVLGRDDSLLLGDVCQHVGPFHVTDSIHARDAGAHVVVDDDALLRECYAQRLEFGADVRPASDGQQNVVAVDVLRQRRSRRVSGHSRTPSGETDWVFAPVMIVTPRFLRVAVRACATSSSSAGRIWGINSTMVTLVPTALKNVAISTPMTPPPMTTSSFGCSLLRKTSSLVQMPGSVKGGNLMGELPVAMMTFFVFDNLAGRIDADVCRIVQGRPAGIDLDVVLLHQVLDSLAQPDDDLVLARHDGAKVGPDTLCGQSELAGLLHARQQLAAGKHRLGGDAAPVRARAAHVGLFCQCDRQTQLSRLDCGDVPSGSAADNE